MLPLCMKLGNYIKLEVRASQLAQALERVVLEYQLQNRVENLVDVSTRCSGILQGEDKLA